MRAGRLDRIVELQRRSLATQNAYGERVQSFATYATVRGSKLDRLARETFAAQGTNVEGTTRFEIRHRTDVLYTDRVLCEGLSYDIVSIAEIGRRKALEIFATVNAS